MCDPFNGPIFVFCDLLLMQKIPISIVILLIGYGYAAPPRFTHHLLYARSKALVYDDFRFRLRAAFQLSWMKFESLHHLRAAAHKRKS